MATRLWSTRKCGWCTAHTRTRPCARWLRIRRRRSVGRVASGSVYWKMGSEVVVVRLNNYRGRGGREDEDGCLRDPVSI
eukprot:46263-Chlamydomonas_euryale.AAC.1